MPFIVNIVFFCSNFVYDGILNKLSKSGTIWIKGGNRKSEKNQKGTGGSLENQNFFCLNWFNSTPTTHTLFLALSTPEGCRPSKPLTLRFSPLIQT